MRELVINNGNKGISAAIHTPNSAKTNKCLIMCHGFRGSKEGGGRATILANWVADTGFSVVRFDFTPLQKLSYQIKELSVVVKYCRQNIGSQIVLLGRSMGGSASLAYSAQDTDLYRYNKRR